jgi:hypothetical protein
MPCYVRRMDLEHDIYWCAVKGLPTPDDALTQVFGPNTSLRKPGSLDSIRGTVDECDHFERRTSTFFTKGDWTFFVAPKHIFKVETMLPDREVVELSCDSTNSWSNLAHWMHGAIDWSVYGAMGEDHVRVEGEVPAAVRHFTYVTENCEQAPIHVGNAITGFRHDKHERPRGFQIVQPPRELILPGNQRVEGPSLARVEAAVASFAGEPGTCLMLKIGEGTAVTTMKASVADGRIRIESLGRARRMPQPESNRPLDKQDVHRCFVEFFDKGTLSKSYSWRT